MATTAIHDERSKLLDKRLETSGWGLFLVILGIIWLVPGERVPEGTWLIAAGGIMLGLNALRYVNAIPISGSTILLGVVALILGVAERGGRHLPLIPLLLVLLGAGMIVRPWLGSRREHTRV